MSSTTPYKDELVRIVSILGLPDNFDVTTLAAEVQVLKTQADAIEAIQTDTDHRLALGVAASVMHDVAVELVRQAPVAMTNGPQAFAIMTAQAEVLSAAVRAAAI